jgi:acetyl-CoA acetyltransferase
MEVEAGRLSERAEQVVVLGAGMHPWGKWGRNFVEYGVVAARAALADAGLAWGDVQYVAAGDTMRNGYRGYVAGSTFAQALGWPGVPASSSYAACASGAVAIEAARARIRAGLADVALVVGADTAPKGFFGPLPGERPDDPDWLRFRVLGATNPTYFGLYARRRMELYGATSKDFAAVKVKNSRHGSSNPNARYRKEFSEDEIAESPVVADPLRLVDICATSDGAAALVLASADFAAKQADRAKQVRIAAISTVTPTYPNTYLDMPDIATESAVGAPPAPLPFRDAIAHAAFEEAGVGPDDLHLAEVYDLSTALELDWYENIGLCAPGEAEALLHSGATTLGGRVPVNPSGGLACFGEAIPAQAIAQVCELVWQLRGEAGGRQVEGATTGLSINQGLFGHGSCVIATA